MAIIQQYQSVNEMEVEQQKIMNEHIYNQLSNDQLTLVGNCNKLWDKPQVIQCFFSTLGFKDIIGLPLVSGRKNKIKYESWYVIKTMADRLGRRVDHLKSQLLKGFEFLTLEQLKQKIQHTQIRGVENELIIPDHLKDHKEKERLFVNHKAILTLVRDIAFKNKEVIVAGKDIRNYAKELINTLDNLDDRITELVDDLSEIIAEYRYKDQMRELQKFKDEQAAIEKEKERLRIARIDLALISFPDRNLLKTHKVYIFSSPLYLSKTVPMVKIGITDNLCVRLKQHQTSCPDGRMYFDIDTYDAKGAEQSLLQMYRNYGLAIKESNSSAEEWIRISSLERTKERLALVADHRNGEYEDLSDECKLIRELLVGEQEPFLIEGGQQYIQIKDVISPNKKFIEKICEKIGINDNKTIVNKTTLLNTIRDVKKHDDFKLIRSKLPIDIDTFLEQKIDGISIKKELKGRSIQITIEITPSE